MGTLRKFDLVLAAALFFIAIGTSLLVADGRYGLEPDGARELHTAQNILAGEGLVDKVVRETSGAPTPHQLVTKPPLYHLSIALLMKMGLAPKLAGWSISQGSFAISAPLLYCLARIALPVFPAFLVGFLFCFQMSGLIWSIYIREDMLFLSLTYASLLIMGLLRGKVKGFKRWLWVLLGVMTACAVLTRYLGIALAATITIVLLANTIRDRKHMQDFLLYLAGLAATALFPLLRFVSLWCYKGVGPAFYKGIESTWFTIAAGLISTFQRDFAGRLLVWLYNQSITDLLILIGSFVILGALLLAADKRRTLMPISIYIGCYLLFLITKLASNGLPSFEPRYAMPVEGLLILLVTAVVWQGIQMGNKQVRVFLITVSMAALVIFFSGQFHRFRNFHAFPNGIESSREICPSPKTIAWIQENIPPGSVIMGTQCCFQLLAETNDYYWLPIPPADEYSASPRFHQRWDEAAFIDAAHTTGARWIAILLGERGDPLADKPGYGPFVTRLLDGQGTNIIKQAARFSDGIVYSMQVP